jgi:hypothetical protein
VVVDRRASSLDEIAREAARYAVLEAIVNELRQSGGRVIRDRDAALVRLIVRTGLDRREIEDVAAELLPLMRCLATELRAMGL